MRRFLSKDGIILFCLKMWIKHYDQKVKAFDHQNASTASTAIRIRRDTLKECFDLYSHVVTLSKIKH